MRDEFWVFGYGSLMWKPGFEFVERVVADLHGYQRRFCLRSIRYRGTPEAPGLVLALDHEPGAVCTGMAYRVSAAVASEVYRYLRQREMVTGAYLESLHPLRLKDGRDVEGLAYSAAPDHPQYAGRLSLAEQARIIAAAEGPAGLNRDYLFSTLEHLSGIGIADPELEALAAEVRALTGAVSG
ncbi:gamma-glutamylcyclotransferase [Paroceanicella profunda]|uniref:glutathione-specific gamma-glutamylcyclotransferase n=1 Tax=Paroceanicella profunda TaxID=2579971 RepID=A0A5B8FVX4_9RHOB|nr:gamma-glutamylcyclotransferase [Paroceanicella profunda]QDL91330.1 gamma-glutamylcyclotransferase [Paroceanicella profunda]